MIADLKIINELYKSVDMGSFSLENAILKVKNHDFKLELDTELDEFNRLKEALKSKLESGNFKIKELNPITKFMAKQKILMNKSNKDGENNLAKMLTQGNNLGVIQIHHFLNKYHGDLDESTVNMLNFLNNMYEDNVKALKTYLWQKAELITLLFIL